MVVYVKLGSVRWIKAERVARRPRRKRQRWQFAGVPGESNPPRLTAARLNAVRRPEICLTWKRIPSLRRSQFVWLPE